MYKLTRLVPIVVEAEQAGDNDAEHQKDDARAGDDDHGPGGAHHIAFFEVTLYENWNKDEASYLKLTFD